MDKGNGKERANKKPFLDSYVTSPEILEILWGLVRASGAKSKSEYLRDLIVREAKAEGLVE